MNSPQHERLAAQVQESNKLSSPSNNSSPINFSLSNEYFYGDNSSKDYHQRAKSPPDDEHGPEDVNVEID